MMDLLSGSLPIEWTIQDGMLLIAPRKLEK
jgi:hypothetical protein